MLDQRIAQQRQRIQDHKGDDSALRDKLNQMKAQRAQRQQGQLGNAPMQTPWSGQYESTVGNLRQQRDNALLGLDASEQSTRKAYGFDNSSDPFSRANQLQQNFANANRGTTNNYAAAGQLYAGSLSNAHGIDRQNFETNWDAAQKEYQSKLDEIAQRRLQAQTDYTQGELDAEAKRLQDAAATRVDPAEAPAQGPGGQNKPGKGKQNNKPPKKGHK